MPTQIDILQEAQTAALLQKANHGDMFFKNGGIRSGAVFFVQTLDANGNTIPTVNQTTINLGTAITGTVATNGTLLILKDGTQVGSQAVNVGAWTYTPTATGSFTFKLSVNNVASAASQAVTVTSSTGGGSGCSGYPAYNPALSYPTAGTRVAFNGKIYESKWWINAGQAPNPSDPWDAWKFIQNCP